MERLLRRQVHFEAIVSTEPLHASKNELTSRDGGQKRNLPYGKEDKQILIEPRDASEILDANGFSPFDHSTQMRSLKPQAAASMSLFQAHRNMTPALGSRQSLEGLMQS